MRALLNPRASSRAATTIGLALMAACGGGPPPNFAPDPGLVGQIRELRMTTTYPRACPGGLIQANYEALLADQSLVPFSRTYDKKYPPRLHVVFLERTSPDAVPQEDGDWVASPDPLATVNTGFRLTATMFAKSTITRTLIIPPDYGCMRHSFGFIGEAGAAGQPGNNGPDVTVRLAVLASPFYDKLFVAGIQVGLAPPFYVLGDATNLPPAAWLQIESRGGRGGAGVQGPAGTDGTAGAAGCPAQAGGPGGNGGYGAPGGQGGRGGRISVIVPIDNPLLAGLVDAHSPGGSGGPGGPGGAGGRGGAGGKGGTDASNRRCADASDGSPGQTGPGGPTGAEGGGGPRSVVVSAPMKDLFGVQLPPGLGSLLERLQRKP